MTLKHLSLQSFRSFSKKEFNFGSHTTIIFGKNTSGKTNTLEAISLLSLGKSFRAIREEEMIKAGDMVARVVGNVEVADEATNLEVMLARETDEPAIGEARYRRHAGVKRLVINGVARRLFSFAGTLKTVLFGPWDVTMVTDSPSTRRRFLDNVLSQVNREYRRSLLSYEKGVRQRNRVLERIREGVASHSQLLYWDHLLIREGNYLTNVRERFVTFVNATPFQGQEFILFYDKSMISEGRLAQYKEQEILSATTLVGPHRDDLLFQTRKEQDVWDLKTYGSRGEQRMAVLWAKLAELDFIEQEAGERPLLLLDDIFSELDPEHHQIVLEATTRQQTIVTTAEPRSIDSSPNAQLIELASDLVH